MFERDTVIMSVPLNLDSVSSDAGARCNLQNISVGVVNSFAGLSIRLFRNAFIVDYLHFCQLKLQQLAKAIKSFEYLAQSKSLQD